MPNLRLKQLAMSPFKHVLGKWEWVWLLMLATHLAACAPISTQVVPTPPPTPTALPLPFDAGSINLGDTLEITLPGRTPVILHWHLEEPSNAEISVKAVGTNEQGGLLDPVIEVLDANNRRIVYADDGDTTTPTDAYIPARGWDVGDYQLRLNTFDGYWSGVVKITIQPSELD